VASPPSRTGEVFKGSAASPFTDLQLEGKVDAITSLAQAATVKPERALPVKMTHAAGEAAADDPPVLHAAIGLAEQIREASEEIERGRRLPPG